MKLSWFRMYEEARCDPKLQSLSDAEFRVWFKLLCYASTRIAHRGRIPVTNWTLLGIECAEGETDVLLSAVDRLIEVEILRKYQNEAGVLELEFINWDKRQYTYPSDTPEAVKKRVQKSRHPASGSSGSGSPCNEMKRVETSQSREEKRRTEDRGVVGQVGDRRAGAREGSAAQKQATTDTLEAKTIATDAGTDRPTDLPPPVLDSRSYRQMLVDEDRLDPSYIDYLDGVLLARNRPPSFPSEWSKAEYYREMARDGKHYSRWQARTGSHPVNGGPAPSGRTLAEVEAGYRQMIRDMGLH